MPKHLDQSSDVPTDQGSAGGSDRMENTCPRPLLQRVFSRQQFHGRLQPDGVSSLADCFSPMLYLGCAQARSLVRRIGGRKRLEMAGQAVEQAKLRMRIQ
jgi:hypothetical protein